ncbi:MAG: hypothetical protein R2865_12440 [Deinococcales bacterium]
MLAISPLVLKGLKLASVAQDGELLLWDLLHPGETTQLSYGQNLSSVGFSADGRYLAAGGEMAMSICGVMKARAIKAVIASKLAIRPLTASSFTPVMATCWPLPIWA